MARCAPLYRLFYRSRQALGVEANVEAVVGQIIATSVARNRAEGVTGLLLVVKAHFVQALEGEIDAVRTTYARISMDPRHSDPHIIAQGPVEKRLFGEWNMCASSLAPSDKAILEVLDGKGDFNPMVLTATSVQRLLTTVANIQRRAPSVA